MRRRLWLVERSRRAFVLLVLVGLFQASCTSKPPPPVQVKGRIVRAKKGVADLRVTFWPRDPKLHRVEALSGPNGEFSLECPAGAYVVTVIPSTGGGQRVPEGGTPTGAPSDQVPGKEKSVPVPARYQERQNTPFTVDVPDEGKDGVLLEIGK